MKDEKTPIRVAVYYSHKAGVDSVRNLFSPADSVEFRPADQFEGGEDIDLAVAMNLCGPSALAGQLAEAGVPFIALRPELYFHPYLAVFQREAGALGAPLLPSNSPEDIAASIEAVRAFVRFRARSLLWVSANPGDYFEDYTQRFASACSQRLGLTVIRKPVDEIKKSADDVTDAEADDVLERWYAHVMDASDKFDENHMRRVAKLYVALKSALEQTDAAGAAVCAIRGFLTLNRNEPEIMPNVSLGALAHDGYLVAEEDDPGALASQWLLKCALGEAATMSNIYLEYRDRFGALGPGEDYTHDMAREDYEQCLRDNHVIISHYSTAGILPPNMMEEERYRVVEALPAWPGQSMVASTPKLGPLVMGRLSADASAIHVLPGEADWRHERDDGTWYRGRWTVKIPSVADFISLCFHHHYALAPENNRTRVLDILAKNILKLEIIG